MGFLSFQFILFIGMTFFLYFVLPKRFQWIVLLACSYLYYYLNSGLLVGVLFGVSVFTFLAGKVLFALNEKIDLAEDKEQKLADRMTVNSEMSGPEKRKIFTLQNGINYWQAFLVGVAQSIAVLPGLSRSGSTIATGLMAKVRRTSLAQFVFIMVIVPILGEAFLELLKVLRGSDMGHFFTIPVLCGFLAAFVSGLFACRLMVGLLKKFRLWGFAVYCFIAGVLCILLPYAIR